MAEVYEAWSDHHFMIEACCPAAHDLLAASLDDERVVADLFRQAGLPGVRRVAVSDLDMVMDYGLRVAPIEWGQARRFVADHHQHCGKPPAGWRFGAAVYNGATRVGVVIVGRPSARLLDRTKVVEVTRLCVNRRLPTALARNACSMLYGWAAREARRRGFRHIVTYIRDVEPGTTVRAAGFVQEKHCRGGDWDRRGRARQSQNTGPKTRWGKALAPRPNSQNNYGIA